MTIGRFKRFNRTRLRPSFSFKLGPYTHTKEKIKILIFCQDLNFRLRVGDFGSDADSASPQNGPEVGASIIRPDPLIKSKINIKQINHNTPNTIIKINNINYKL